MNWEQLGAVLGLLGGGGAGGYVIGRLHQELLQRRQAHDELRAELEEQLSFDRWENEL